VSRVLLANGMHKGDVDIQATGPVEVTHGIANIQPGGTTEWISWPGTIVATMKTGRLAYRNASENDCSERTVAAGQSFIVQAKTVFEAVNAGSETAEVHVTGFLPPGQRVKAEEKPANC
jgi:quercetin dioxygenase-like cupin family protein